MTAAREQRLTQVFVEAADTLVDEFDVLDFLQRLSRRCVELLDVSAAGILLADIHDDLQLVAASDEHTRLLELFALQHDQGPCVVCYRTGAPATNIDLDHAQTTLGWDRFAQQARASGFATTHAIPLRLRSRVVGALNLFHTKTQRLTGEDVILAQALADVATISILQQRTLQASNTERAQLQAALNSRIILEQAKGILAERLTLTPDEAFTALRTYVRSHNLRLSDAARQVIEGTLDIPQPPEPDAAA
ncbi:GAF and ANTAR domain-containing protein [Streptomyces sp. NBC_00237]|uniref:GAF and ANTAR domain-containing protein n=1 Tax=Streptomyces sp. NBC_00237 TaxID=2975687 RepID=UPI0022531703|nr:GAF and ANTAR domain-containing protein [Streptomyces sp. NBC_00237]MCX5205757.1 GAF and ANTAR domain-containing protein [Streptomyces sp. NBC_00237]